MQALSYAKALPHRVKRSPKETSGGLSNLPGPVGPDPFLILPQGNNWHDGFLFGSMYFIHCVVSMYCAVLTYLSVLCRLAVLQQFASPASPLDLS
jgi:hypothetical protein